MVIKPVLASCKCWFESHLLCLQSSSLPMHAREDSPSTGSVVTPVGDLAQVPDPWLQYEPAPAVAAI